MTNPVRVTLAAIACSAMIATASAQPYEPYPPPYAPAAPVAGPGRASFISTGATQWDVFVDDQPACVTPCAVYVDPGRWVRMQARSRPRTRLDVGQITGDVVVQAKPRSQGAFVTGLTFTSLGGMAVVTGISLWGVGCFVDGRERMCKAGKITTAAGAGVTLGGLLLLFSGRASARVLPARTSVYVTDREAGIAGTF